MSTMSGWHWGTLLAIYFLPALIAFLRRHHNAGAILALNVLLGWTGLGWIASFVWSLTATRRPLALRL